MKIELEVEDPKRLWADLHAAIDACGNGAVAHRLREVNTQIEAQIPKPRVPEPGMWGVVEAHTEGNPTRCRYGRTRAGSWVREGFSAGWQWSELIDPVLIREGI